MYKAINIGFVLTKKQLDTLLKQQSLIELQNAHLYKSKYFIAIYHVLLEKKNNETIERYGIKQTAFSLYDSAIDDFINEEKIYYPFIGGKIPVLYIHKQDKNTRFDIRVPIYMVKDYIAGKKTLFLDNELIQIIKPNKQLYSIPSVKLNAIPYLSVYDDYFTILLSMLMTFHETRYKVLKKYVYDTEYPGALKHLLIEHNIPTIAFNYIISLIANKVKKYHSLNDINIMEQPLLLFDDLRIKQYPLYILRTTYLLQALLYNRHMVDFDPLIGMYYKMNVIEDEFHSYMEWYAKIVEKYNELLGEYLLQVPQDLNMLITDKNKESKDKLNNVYGQKKVINDISKNNEIEQKQLKTKQQMAIETSNVQTNVNNILDEEYLYSVCPYHIIMGHAIYKILQIPEQYNIVFRDQFAVLYLMRILANILNSVNNPIKI